MPQVELSWWQIKIAEYLMIPKAMRPSIAEFLGETGITRGQFQYWKLQPEILELKSKLTKLYFKDEIPDILQAVKNNAIAGDTQAAKLFLQYVDNWEAEQAQTKVVNQINITYSPTEVQQIVQELRDKKI